MSVIRQYLATGLIDEVHLAVSPVVLGRGEHLYTGLDLPALGYAVHRQQSTPHATHVTLTRSH